MGTMDSWDQTISVSGRDNYSSCTWSPCGRFVAAQTTDTVEIRNHLTFEPLIQSTNRPGHLSTGPLAYSPDGRSLARGCSRSILVCDIQTGGLAKEIECDLDVATLTWSLDGRTIATTNQGRDVLLSVVEVYDVASGAQLFAERLRALATTYYLWASEPSFRFMKAVYSKPVYKFSIFEIGPPFIEIESFDVTGVAEFSSFAQPQITFCPSTYHVAVLGYGTLTILDIRSSGRLLELEGPFTSFQFSPDGSFFAASRDDNIRVWRHSSDTYIRWGELPLPYLPSRLSTTPSLQFSPTFSSILSLCGNVLQVRRMQDPPTTRKKDRRFAAISRSGRHVATAYLYDATVTITDLYSQAPVQFVDLGFEPAGLLIFGNVLLVIDRKKVVALLLTEEGVVDGVFRGGRVGRSSIIWTMSVPESGRRRIRFRFKGQVGVIEDKVNKPFLYHTETGERLKRVHMPSKFSCPWIYFYEDDFGQNRYHLPYHDPSQHGTPPKDGWLFSHNRMEEIEWVVDHEGRRRFWVPVDWRKSCSQKNWCQDITSLFIRVREQPIIIKFQT